MAATPAVDPPGAWLRTLVARPPCRTFVQALVLVLPAWILARVIVVGTLLAARLTVGTVRPHNPAALARVHQGLLAWDGGWYVSIARHGYAASGLQSVRFYPVFPIVARLLGRIPGVGIDVALVAMANLAALAAMAGLAILVEHDLGDRTLARRSAWLLGLAPPAYALVWGYADGPLLLCAVVAFLGARTGRWWWAAAAGLVAGGMRPVGVLLVVPMVVEVVLVHRREGRTGDRDVAAAVVGSSTPAINTSSAGTTVTGQPGPQQRRRPGTWSGELAAVAAPLAGTAAFLVWVRHRFGDAWLPFRVQEQNGHRGGFTFPVTPMVHDLQAALHGHHLGSALHVPWVVACTALAVLAFRRLPLSYGAFAVVVLVVSLSSANLDSFERYALGAFPLVVAASTLTARRNVEAAVLVVAAAGMAAYGYLALIGVLVP